MAISKGAYSAKSSYNVIYSNMRGVDFSGDGSDISRQRFSYAENMYRDYDGEGGTLTESIPGFRKIYSAGATINGLYSFTDEQGAEHLVIHAGTSIYRYPLASLDSYSAKESLCTVANTGSHAFRYGSALYILDGTDIIAVTSSGASKVLDHLGTPPYIPTTYVNGAEYEQRNMLTRYFYETYTAGSARTIAYGSMGLEYEITDDERLECAVAGRGTAGTEIYIPASVKIGEITYEVKAIADEAFASDTDITGIIIANGTIRIGANAFSGCTSLRFVFMRDSVELIEAGAFSGCTSLATIYLSSELKEIGSSAFSLCSTLTTVAYGAGEADFSEVINNDALSNKSILYNTKYSRFAAYIPVFSPSTYIHEVYIDGQTQPFLTLRASGSEKVTGVAIFLDSERKIVGKDVKLFGKLSEDPEIYKGYSGFPASSLASDITSMADAIKKCTVAECFDGKVFLSGNPSLPGVCFYSSFDSGGENNPLYFGENNYWRDGDGVFNTVALLATSDSLAVFNSSSSAGAGIFYHTPKETGIDVIPKIYPVSYSHRGMDVCAGAISFFDDPVFVSKSGISALDKKEINLERSIALRSHNVNSKLLCEDLSRAELAVWCGYLVVAVGEHIYLADSRSTFTHSSGNTEYEWYYLSGIGTYTLDHDVYRYSSAPCDGYEMHPSPDSIVPEEISVISVKAEDGTLIYYTAEDGKRYRVYKTEQKRGGTFSPLSKICVVGDRLFFGTESGSICVFNNDMRGVAPESIKNEDDFDEEKYAEAYGRRIHSSYYSFNHHAPRYALKTAFDNASIPHLLKDTEKRSMTVKCRAFSGGAITCEVGTDNSGYSQVCRFPSSSFSFSDLDFSNVSLNADDSFTVLISEKEKGWVEKQITLYSDEYCAPFGIYNIAYRFKIRGKLRVSV